MWNLTYQSVEEVIRANNVAMSAAEAHGMLVGMLCLNSLVTHDAWISAVFEDVKSPVGDKTIYIELWSETKQKLIANDFSFELFLPNEGALLSGRAQALSEWCHGFLHGLGTGINMGARSDECSEVLRDLIEVSKLDTSLATADQHEEDALIELIKYVCFGVQMIYTELRKQPRYH